MSTPDKPLHVQVAEALGWEKCARTGPVQYYDRDIRIDNREWTGVDPVVVDRSYRRVVFRYDLDWSVTGPLIKKYQFALRRYPTDDGVGFWSASTVTPKDATVDAVVHFGPTPLLAICNLIIALAKEGKLNA